MYVYVQLYRQLRLQSDLYENIIAHKSRCADLLADVLAEDEKDFGVDVSDGNQKADGDMRIECQSGLEAECADWKEKSGRVVSQEGGMEPNTYGECS